jgi:DNA-binding SARP family transcriptional activator/tetratricopeptide (TPR) repeat protein
MSITFEDARQPIVIRPSAQPYASPMLRVRLLGELAVETPRGLVAPPSRPARELLAWLALHPGMHPRLELASRFWPDVLESSARASLRTALHELRRAIGEDAVTADRELVGLAGEPWVDMLAVRELPAEEALALCAGDALPGLDRDWAIGARDEHRELVAGLLAGLADATSGEEALRWARELVRADPLSEDAARRLMRLLAGAGDRAAALAAYARLEERLRRELRVVPSRRTRELVAEIRAEGAGEDDAVGDGVDASGASGGAVARRDDGEGDAPRAVLARGPLAGRAADLARIRGLIAPGRLVAIAGEPGIGKTRLLAELSDGARYGRCYEESLTPYQPFVEALGAVMPEADGEGGRWRLFEAIGARLEGERLLLDDLHWADAGTLRLLTHLLHRPSAPAVVAAYRDSEISRVHPLAATLADLRRDGLIERVALHGLDESAVAELAGGAIDAHTLQRETGGNPFFVEQVLRHLADGGDPDAIPEGVKDVIGRRLARLAPGTGRVLAYASVAGREFELALLEAVLRGVDVLAALEEATAAQMIREERPGRYAFTHALVRETLYDELSLTRRVRTHRELADALPEDRLAELAHHRLQAAAAGDVGAAADAALAAARDAMRAFAYEDAAALCERALEAVGESPRRGELLLALGDARLRAGEKDEAREAFAAAAGVARDAADAELLAHAALGFSGLGVTIIAVDREAVALLQDALESAEGPLRARLLSRLAIETYYESTPAQRKRLVDEAVKLEPSTDALNARHAALWSAQYLDERLETADRMIAEATTAEAELQGRNWRVLDLMEKGDLDEAREEIDRHERLAERLRLPAYEWWAPMWRSSLAILEGRFEDAERLVDRFRDAADPNARLYAEIQGVVAAVVRGRPVPFDDARVMERESGRPAEYAYRAGHAWILALAGRADEARAEIAYAVAHLKDDMNRLAAIVEMTEALRILGEPGPAAQLYDALAPYADRNVLNARGAAGYGSASLHLGTLARLLGRDEDADRHFRDANAHNQRLGAAVWIERSAGSTSLP